MTIVEMHSKLSLRFMASDWSYSFPSTVGYYRINCNENWLRHAMTIRPNNNNHVDDDGARYYGYKQFAIIEVWRSILRCLASVQSAFAILQIGK